MDWARSYRPERRVSWGDIADAIRSSVTMENVLDAYCPSLPRRGHRCPCPIHNGKDYNFSYNTHGYCCFVCGASGDVVAFVKEVCELATRADAMRKINSDFRLALPIGAPAAPQISVEVARRRAEAERKRAEHGAWLDQYHALMDKFVDYQRILMNGDPSSDEYAEAAKKIDYIEDQLDSMPPEPR